MNCLAYDLAGLVCPFRSFIGGPTGPDVPHQVINKGLLLIHDVKQNSCALRNNLLYIACSEANGSSQASSSLLSSEQMAPRGQLVFAVGLGALVFVPVFKSLTGLPPFMGMLLGLGVLWILTDAIHYGESGRQRLKVPQALSRIDTQGILFFLGILLSVGR